MDYTNLRTYYANLKSGAKDSKVCLTKREACMYFTRKHASQLISVYFFDGRNNRVEVMK